MKHSFSTMGSAKLQNNQRRSSRCFAFPRFIVHSSFPTLFFFFFFLLLFISLNPFFLYQRRVRSAQVTIGRNQAGTKVVRERDVFNAGRKAVSAGASF